MMRGSRKRALGVAGLSAVAIVAVVVPAVIAGPGDTTLASRQSQAAGGQGHNGFIYSVDISASGRFVAFTTDASNLGGPVQAPLNIYVYDRKRKRVALVSRQSRSAGGEGADGASSGAAISDDGRFVAFRSQATNLGGPIQSDNNIYVYDRERKRVQLVSRQSRRAGGQGANGFSEDAAISGNGRVVSFQTLATNLGGGQLNDPVNFYAYDRRRKRVELVSRQSRAAGGEGQNGSYFDDRGSSLSANGRFVAFMTPATNLGGPIVPGVDNVYVYDRERDRIQLVSRRSRAAGGEGGDGTSNANALSASGRFVAFDTSSTNLGGPIGAGQNVYVYDRERKRVALVSRASRGAGGAGGDGLSYDPSISGGGRFVAFTSNAQNFGGDPAVLTNVWLYDRERKRVRLVSRQSPGLGGDAADQFSDSPAVAAAGRFVAFSTSADNLGGPVDPGAATNVYIHQRRGR